MSPRPAFAVSVAEHAAAVRALVLSSPAFGGGAAGVPSPGPASAETVPLGAALGRMLGAELRTPIELPPFANSQMDGYAVRSIDAPGIRAVVAHIAAGDRISGRSVAAPLAPGEVAAIMTGAPLPAGADAVVPVEEVAAGFVAPGGSIEITAPVEAGRFVRGRGSDLAAGAVLLPAGVRLGPAQLGAAAAAGIAAVPVRPRPRVLVVSTGAELAGPGDDPGSGDGTIFDANSMSLAAALTEVGAVALATSVPNDDPRQLAAALEAAGPVDLVVTSGGVSAGAHEVVRELLEPRGVAFGSVAMQPGGPQGLGTIEVAGRPTPILCFPGNPVSVLVSFELFLRPLLRGARPSARARLAGSLVSPAAKHQLRRGLLADDGTVTLVGGPSSHLLASYARSDALVHVPVGVERLDAGAEVEIWRIDV